MANFPVFHGITLAANAYIENLNLEVLASDPVPVGPGRVWFNSTEKSIKFSGLDAGGAVIVRSIKDAESAATELSAVNASLAAIRAEAVAAGASLSSDLADETQRATAAEAGLNSKIDSVKQELLGGIPPETLDTIRELATALRDNPNVLSVLEAKIGTDIAAAKEELKGAVSGAFDTLVELESGLVKEISDRQKAVSDEAAARVAGDAALDGRLTSVEGQTSGKIGTLTSLTTDVKSSLVQAINEVDAHADAAAADAAAEKARALSAEGVLDGKISAEKGRAEAVEGGLAQSISNEAIRANSVELGLRTDLGTEVAARSAAVSAVKAGYNASLFTFQATAAATVHTITHGLGSEFVALEVEVERSNGRYYNDIVCVETVDVNTKTVYLSQALKVKVIARSAVAL